MKLLLVILCFSVIARAVPPDQKTLPIGFAPHEIGRVLRDGPMTAPPVGPIRSLGEWELADSAVTLWMNASHVKALAQRGKLALLADSSGDKQSWISWLDNNDIETKNIAFHVVPTDSMWIRDYGPWYILDGHGTLGIVDTKYNRPRPQDDVVPSFLSKALDLPMFQPGLVHTGGNYYSDGQGNAFSSTLVFRENPGITATEVLGRAKRFLGIDRYTTSRLSPGSTIEHIDTFGKLVAPDTWVFSEFPVGSPHRVDSEAMVAILKTLKSPYGTPYKIFRMKMTPISAGSDYRAYINSFISNGALYYPTYGGQADMDAKEIYQKALPGYEIVGVSAMGTQWGDSVHCRSNNFYARDTVFVFPHVSGREVLTEVYPSPGAQMVRAPEIFWTLDGVEQAPLVMTPDTGRYFRAVFPETGKISFYVKATDSTGKTKTAPIRAPAMTIDLDN